METKWKLGQPGGAIGHPGCPKERIALMICDDCGDTKICQHCGGDGQNPDGAPGDECPVCDGSGICQFCKDGPLGTDLPREESVDLGPCCACGQSGHTVRNIIMLDRLCPTPGRGWGCLQCGLPLDYAIAVLCDVCLESKAEIKFVCTGYPAEGGRTPIEQAPEAKVKHNPLYYPEMIQAMTFFDTSPEYGHPDCLCSVCGDSIPDPDEQDEAYQERFVPLRLYRQPSKKHPTGQEARFCIDCGPAVLKYGSFK
jgi:hypothetical protein